MSESKLISSQRLRRVWYEVFESDVDVLDLSSEVHVLDREVRLEFDARPPLFVTWRCGHPDVAYCVTVSAESAFRPPAPAVVDASSSPIWEPLIGLMIEMDFLDETHQALRI